MAKVQNIPTLYAEETTKAEAILKGIGSAVVSITDGVKELAELVLSVRAQIIRPITSKKTGKLVDNVPDFRGSSPEYRSWFNDTLVPLMEATIPEDYRGTIRGRLQNQVQELAHKTATPAQKAHLGMSAVSKKTAQQNKRNAEKEKATQSRQTDEHLSTDDVREIAKSAPAREVAQDIAAMAEALSQRVRSSDFAASKSEAQAASKLVAQAIQHLMSVRAGLDSLAGAKEKTAA